MDATELHADTVAGAAMVDAATRFAAEFAAGALVHDRKGGLLARTALGLPPDDAR